MKLTNDELVGKTVTIENNNFNIMSGYNYDSPVVLRKKHIKSGMFYVEYISANGEVIDNGVIHRSVIMEVLD